MHTKQVYNLGALMPVGNYSYQFFICCPRDCVSRHNGGTSGAPLKPLRVDSALIDSIKIKYSFGVSCENLNIREKSPFM